MPACKYNSGPKYNSDTKKPIYILNMLKETILQPAELKKMNDKTTGWIILLGSLLGIVIYFYLLFLSPWIWVTIQISAMLAVGGVLLIIAWIGYTLATTPPPMPLEDFDIETDIDVTG
jgi:predicted DNA-binding transcriptional regulator